MTKPSDIWKALLPGPYPRTLFTTVKENAFKLMAVTETGIELLVPSENGEQRDVVLDYERLEALWRSRDSVEHRPPEQRLTTAINAVWKNRGLLRSSCEAQYWALVQKRADPQPVIQALADSGSDYVPSAEDSRALVERQIHERRGQEAFKKALLARHGSKCMITACDVPAVLEAAHIDPYRGEETSHPGNGLILRSDIHKLFDSGLLGIEPSSFTIHIHPAIVKQYGSLAGITLAFAPGRAPSETALQRRFEEFGNKLKERPFTQ